MSENNFLFRLPPKTRTFLHSILVYIWLSEFSSNVIIFWHGIIRIFFSLASHYLSEIDKEINFLIFLS